MPSVEDRRQTDHVSLLTLTNNLHFQSQASYGHHDPYIDAKNQHSRSGGSKVTMETDVRTYPTDFDTWAVNAVGSQSSVKSRAGKNIVLKYLSFKVLSFLGF